MTVSKQPCVFLSHIFPLFQLNPD